MLFSKSRSVVLVSMFLLSDYDIYAAPDRGAEYCDDRVCLSVRVFVCLSPKLQVRSSPIFVHVTCGHGSVLVDMLSTFGFMNGVTFAHNVTAYSDTKTACASSKSPGGGNGGGVCSLHYLANIKRLSWTAK